MPNKFFKRVFSRQAPVNLTKSIRCPEPMWNAIKKLAQEHGETANAFIIVALDDWLQSQLASGKIEVPNFETEPVEEIA